MERTHAENVHADRESASGRMPRATLDRALLSRTFGDHTNAESALLDRDDGARQRLVELLQGSAGNAAIQRMLAPVQREPLPAAAPPGLSMGTDGSVKLAYPLPSMPLEETTVGPVAAKLTLDGAVGASVTPPTDKPVTGPTGSQATMPDLGPGLRPEGVGVNPDVPGGGGLSSSGASSEAGDTTKYQADISYEWQKQKDGLLAGWAPKVSLAGEAGTAGYKLGLGGVLQGENVDLKFGFTFVDAGTKDGVPEIKFATLEAAAELKALTYKFVGESTGATISVTFRPSVKVTLTPDYKKILQWFMEECAESVALEVAVVGAFVAGGVLTVAGAALTVGQGGEMAVIIDRASRLRDEYVRGFVGAITQRDESFDNDYAMEGHLRGEQWLREREAGTSSKGLAIPASVLKEKVKDHEAKARAQAEAAVNADLHVTLVQQYWEIHDWRAALGHVGGIEDIFRHLMEEKGFGLPRADETGEERPQPVSIQ